MARDPIDIFEPSWEDERDSPPGFRSRRPYLARMLGSDQLGVGPWELEGDLTLLKIVDAEDVDQGVFTGEPSTS